MRILANEGHLVSEATLLLTQSEAEALVGSLNDLLAHPEADEHAHVTDRSKRVLTIEVVTHTKLAAVRRPESGGSELGRAALAEEWSWE